MDRSRGQQPGYKHPAARPNSSVAPTANTSIFGLISKVNKGILKNPIPQGQKPTSVQTNPLPPEPDYKPPELSDKEKQDVFLQAKNRVEEIQKGLWKTRQDRKTAEVSEPFKVPQLPTRPGKPNQGSLSGQSPRVKDHIQGQQGQDSGQPKTTLPLVEYDDDEEDQPKRGSSYDREKALEEIDRYRARGTTGRGSGGREATQTREYEREDYHSSSYRKDRYVSRESDSDKESKSQVSRYDAHHRLSEESRHKQADETKEGDKHLSSYEVFDYGHTSDHGSMEEEENDNKMKSRRFEETKRIDVRKFEETKQIDRDSKDSNFRDHNRRSFDTNRRYDEEVRTRHIDPQYSSKNIESHREQPRERYQREYQGETRETRGCWDDGQNSDRYSGTYRRGYEETSGQYDRDSTAIGYTRYNVYSDEHPNPSQSYGRDSETQSHRISHGSDRIDYVDRADKYKESISETRTKRREEGNTGSGDMLYEDFLFGTKDEKQKDKEETFDKDSTRFEPDRKKFNTYKDSRHFEQDRDKFDSSKDYRHFEQDGEKFGSKDSKGYQQRDTFGTFQDSQNFGKDRDAFETSKDYNQFGKERQSRFVEDKSSGNDNRDRSVEGKRKRVSRFGPKEDDQYGSTRDIPHSSENQYGSNRDAPHSSASQYVSNRDAPHSSAGQFGSNRDAPHSSAGQFGSNRDTPHSSAGQFGSNRDIPHSPAGQYGSNRDAPHSSAGQFGSNRDTPHSLAGQFGSSRDTPRSSAGQFGSNRESPYSAAGQYGSSRDSPYLSDGGKPFYGERWASEKSEAIGSGLKNSRRDGEDVQAGSEPVVAAGTYSLTLNPHINFHIFSYYEY